MKYKKTNIATRATEMFGQDAITEMNCTDGDPSDQGDYPAHPASHNNRLLTITSEMFEVHFTELFFFFKALTNSQL